eukprot:SAG31_NODE_7739_length_1606_cov_0.978766_2_plen_272_part_00
MVDDELRRKYNEEALQTALELEAAGKAAAGVKAARARLATAREKLRIIEKFKDTRPTTAEAAVVSRGIDAEICETTRLLESTRIPKATHSRTRRELHRTVGELSVLIHARAVRQATFGPGVQKIMLEVNVNQCPATAVTATVLYSHARAAIKRELLEATAAVASLQGCKHSYRLAKRQLLAAEGALEFITFLLKQQPHEIKHVIMMVEGLAWLWPRWLLFQSLLLLHRARWNFFRRVPFWEDWMALVPKLDKLPVQKQQRLKEQPTRPEPR